MKKLLILLGTFLLLGVLVWSAAKFANPSVSFPQAIDESSPCPATMCASGVCHGFDNVPIPDGVHEMECPESGCASLECHAWDALSSRYHRTSDMSLNLWILLPALLVGGFTILLLRKR